MHANPLQLRLERLPGKLCIVILYAKFQGYDIKILSIFIVLQSEASILEFLMKTEKLKSQPICLTKTKSLRQEHIIQIGILIVRYQTIHRSQNRVITVVQTNQAVDCSRIHAP